MIRLAVFIIIMVITFCSKERPPIQPELANFSEPGEALPFFSGSNFDPVWTFQDEDKLRRLTRLGLTNQNGKRKVLQDLRGRVTVLYFFFASCHGICPLVTRNVKYVANKYIGNDRVTLLSLSLHPSVDTPARLEYFASKYQIKQHNWHFLTGSKNIIYSIARNDFDADLDLPAKSGPDDFLHTENVYLLDQKQRLRGIYKGRGIAPMKQLTEDIKKLLQET